MDFSFTPEQDDLRREARAFLEATPSPTMEQLAELGWVGILQSDDFTFLDAAVLFEELGRVLYDGPFVLNEVAAQPGDDVWSIEIDGFVPHLAAGAARAHARACTRASREGETVATVDETLGLGKALAERRRAAPRATGTTSRRRLLAALALEAVGIGSKAIELAIAYVAEREQFGKKIGTYQAISHSLVDGYVAVELVALARLLGGVVRRGGRRAGRPGRRRREVAGDRGRGARLREVDPGARRHRLHVGAPAAPLLQARALARRRARVRPRAPRGDRDIPAVLVTGASTGIGARDRARGCATAAGRSTHRCGAPGEAPAGTTRARLRRHRPGARSAMRPRAIERARRARRQRRDRDRGAARVPAAGGADAAARRQRRRPAAGAAGVPAGAAAVARPRRADGVDRRPLGAAVPRRLRDVEVRARGDGRRAAGRARAVGHPRRDRRARARSRPRSGRSRSRRSTSSRPRPPSSTASGSARFRALAAERAAARRCRRSRSVADAVEHALTVGEAEDALPRRPGREAARACAEAARTACATGC